jgi:uncharacterized protein (DUF427 family)
MKRIPPKAGQESVWDYPRPPRVETTNKRIKVIFQGEVIADTTNAKRVLETSHPPTYYIPPEDVRFEMLEPTSRSTVCEFKGAATYYNVTRDGVTNANAAWAYATPRPGFESIRDHITFYASKVDACYVGDELVTAQAGDFYGGWITSDIVGPFKGGAGTWGW